ncbi:hypothetical protein AK812_SmicGene13370 [Symbiodinium microadriaticum]|uniref:Uncharacterized protein n=1 Tax=Symbiodinium microadriaticum TaxID=2951 RepID=A0A1Q9E899_SYMMI|nr:hypothetical protein AK812_SmicGene13370 [Symbiodinium microadriaticum]CAE6965065.1 unnamed protein product [Symbiodinium sp. KB8]CAE7189016.1 unnamed protein product [Symbiodinium microadriaticum]
MADWDPFADPGDDSSQAPASPPKPKPVIEPSKAKKGADDIFAALRFLEEGAQQPPPTDVDEFKSKLDVLFSTPDGEIDSVKSAYAEVARLSAGDGSRTISTWQRALGMLEAKECSNLLGLLIDDSVGLNSDPSKTGISAIHLDVPEEDSGEVVFLLSWGGGTLQDMEDVAKMYRELLPGCTIFISTSNRKQSFGLRCQCAFGIKSAAEAWSRSKRPPKLLVHMFSNSGMHAWTEILQAWGAIRSSEEHLGVLDDLPPLEDVLRGIVMDSACDSAVPLDSCIQSFVQSMAGTVAFAASSDHDGSEDGKRAAEVAGKRAVASLIGSASVAKSHLYSKPPKTLTKLADADTAIVHRLEPPVPMQFIYSKDDNIIVPQGVERYLQEVKDRPSRKGLSQPRVWCLEKSRHCFHKLTDPVEYRNCIALFASSTMS